MKAPTGHEEDTDEWGDPLGLCVTCVQSWPCKTWQRWTNSKDYRIALLQQEVKALRKMAIDGQRRLGRVERTKDIHHKVLFLGLLPAVNSAGASTVEVTFEQEAVEVSSVAGRTTRVPGMEDVNVIRRTAYPSGTRHTFENGRMTEERP